MACILDSGVALACRDNTGGVARVYIGAYNTGLVIGLSASNNSVIDSFTGATGSFYEFQQDVEVASFTQPVATNTENGTVEITQTLELTLPKLNADLRNKFKTLVQGKWRVIIQDQLGTYWFMGYRNAVRVNTGSADLGKAFLDLNGLKLTFTTKEAEPAYVVSSSAVAQVAVAAS